MNFDSQRAAHVVAFELGTCTCEGEKSLLMAVSRVLGLVQLRSLSSEYQAREFITVGCKASYLSRIIRQNAMEKNDDTIRDVTIVNIDRFYLRSPCASVWEYLSPGHVSDGRFACAACHDVVFLPLRYCIPCFSRARRRLETSNPRDFGSIDFWGSHFETDPTSGEEWFLSWKEIKRTFLQTVAEILPQRRRVLVPGNGYSNLAHDITNENIFGEVVATDVVHAVCETMKFRSMSCQAKSPHTASNLTSELLFLADDIVRSSLGTGSFDCILDKGLLDALACSLRSDNEAPDMAAAVSEYHRLLAPGGLIFVASGRGLSSILRPFGVLSWELIKEVRFEARISDKSPVCVRSSNGYSCSVIALRSRPPAARDP